MSPSTSKTARKTQKNRKSSDITTCINPATGEILGKVPIQTIKDVTEAVLRAREAQIGWGKLDIDKRIILKT